MSSLFRPLSVLRAGHHEQPGRPARAQSALGRARATVAMPRRGARGGGRARGGVARGPVVRLPVRLAGRPGQEEVAARGDRHVAALRPALHLGEAALVVRRAADACAAGRRVRIKFRAVAADERWMLTSVEAWLSRTPLPESVSAIRYGVVTMQGQACRPSAQGQRCSTAHCQIMGLHAYPTHHQKSGSCCRPAAHRTRPCG